MIVIRVANFQQVVLIRKQSFPYSPIPGQPTGLLIQDGRIAGETDILAHQGCLHRNTLCIALGTVGEERICAGRKDRPRSRPISLALTA